MTRTICLHGAESSGKSSLAPRLAARLGGIWVPEYGRAYCEEHGQDLTMADLVAIADGQERLARSALDDAPDWLLLDTDPLMTIAWADMLFGARDPALAAWNRPADLYLLMDVDLPFAPDPVRFFGDDLRRRRFFRLAKAVLDERGVAYALVSGIGEARLEAALAAIDAAGLGKP